MDEAKSLVHMSVSAIFAAMLLGAVAGLIALSYLMWGYFSRQDMANSRLSYYSNLTVFDNTTVRGSEVLSLLSEADELGIFILFYNTNDSTPSNKVLDGINVVAATPYFYCNPNDAAHNIRAKNTSYVNDIPVCQATLAQVQALIPEGRSLGEIKPAAEMNSLNNLYNRSRSQQISILTSTLGSCTQADTYGIFKSTLIYANDGTTDIVGVALTRVANSQINDYCMD